MRACVCCWVLAAHLSFICFPLYFNRRQIRALEAESLRDGAAGWALALSPPWQLRLILFRQWFLTVSVGSARWVGFATQNNTMRCQNYLSIIFLWRRLLDVKLFELLLSKATKSKFYHMLWTNSHFVSNSLFILLPTLWKRPLIKRSSPLMWPFLILMLSMGL